MVAQIPLYTLHVMQLSRCIWCLKDMERSFLWPKSNISFCIPDWSMHISTLFSVVVCFFFWFVCLLAANFNWFIYLYLFFDWARIIGREIAFISTLSSFRYWLGQSTVIVLFMAFVLHWMLDKWEKKTTNRMGTVLTTLTAQYRNLTFPPATWPNGDGLFGLLVLICLEIQHFFNTVFS